MTEPTATGFTSLLIANRGEIALRIMRSARAEGLRCIAVHTRADAGAPHVGFADRAVCIGDGPAADSYLSIDRILAAACETGAGAVHPGYGFLSESAEFARACADAGLVFIGPSPEAIALMGNKAEAKRLMAAAGVPCIAGYHGADQSDGALAGAARDIGYPVMIKAAAGGGGRGMRLVGDESGFADALHLARTEAAAAFGSDQIILEKAILRPRHVEIQVIGDRHGNVVHLGERDCSIQRRHQKLVEEAPCPVMTPELRQAMGAAAVAAARGIDYEGAGTVEFLLDRDGNFHFLEMNTRLQVEHPVSELVTGRDIVALQLAVARGEALGFDQSDVTLSGHAIEIRLCAEDPARDFLPVSGDIALWRPARGEGIRVDAGIVTGQTVPVFYDSMLAKIIGYGATRQEARQRLIAALQDTVLFGVTSNRDFLIDVVSRPEFAAGRATTAFIDEEYGDRIAASFALGDDDFALAAALAYREMQARAAKAAVLVPRALWGWGSPGCLNARLTLSDVERSRAVTLRETRGGELAVDVGGRVFRVTGRGKDMRIDGLRADIRAFRLAGGRIHLATGSRSFSLALEGSSGADARDAAGGSVLAPMHGNLQAVFVAPGERVAAGARLAVLEAMKIQHELLAEVAGVVRNVAARAGSQVRAGDLLIEMDVDDVAPPPVSAAPG